MPGKKFPMAPLKTVAKCGVVQQPVESDNKLHKEFADKFKELTSEMRIDC